jgi:hypothetical protein
MTTYNVTNEKYNINFDLKFDSFYNFFESLKESKKYYSDCCNLENINIVDFDNEYIENINILKSELLKIYILITNDDVEKYIIVDDTIEDLFNFIIEIFERNIFESRLLYPPGYRDTVTKIEVLHTNHQYCSLNTYIPGHKEMYLLENDKIFMTNLDINYLTKYSLSRLIDIYACNASRYAHFMKGFLSKMNISTSFVTDQSNNGPDYNDAGNRTNKYIKLKEIYLDSLEYESIYDRELTKILINLPNICISNISSKKLLNNISNETNLINLNEDLDDKYIAVD